MKAFMLIGLIALAGCTNSYDLGFNAANPYRACKVVKLIDRVTGASSRHVMCIKREVLP